MSSSTMVIDEDEEVEVRGLLNRHRERIIADLENTDMLTVLVKKNVISVITEALLINYRSVPEDQKRKCDLLIDTVAKCGFKKFKEFCYAIEEECPQLITEMINDHVPGSGTTATALDNKAAKVHGPSIGNKRLYYISSKWCFPNPISLWNLGVRQFFTERNLKSRLSWCP